MFQADSSSHTFHPKSKPQPSFASTLLNYESKGYEFENATQTRKNEYQSQKNSSLDDSEEVTRRMDLLKRNLGLPVQKQTNYSIDEQVFKNYLGNNNRDQQQSFLHGLGNSIKKDRELSDYLNLDEDSVFQTESKSQNLRQKSINSKGQDQTPYKLSVSEDASPYKEQSFERELGNYATQGMSFKVYKDEEKEARNSALALQRENELLRKKLEEERSLQEDQKKILNAHLEEYRKTVAFDKESEDLLKQNITFYKGQIQDLEKQLTEFRAQQHNHQHLENSTVKNILAEQEQFKYREQNYLLEIESLKKDLQILRQQDFGFEQSGNSDTYVRKLEVNIRFLNNQVTELSQDKSHLQTINENLEHEIKILSDKLYAEIEDKYRKEIEEKDFIIKSLKRDFELYLQMDGDPAHKAAFRKTQKKKLTRTTVDLEGKKGRGSRGSEDDIEGTYMRLNQLENENFLLKEKLDFLEIQSRGSRNPRESVGSQLNSYETQINHRRIQTLRESVVFWKEKSEKIATIILGALRDLREENEALRESLTAKVEGFDEEIEGFMKKIKKHYKKEQVKILDMVSSLEEKHYQNQAKLADARSKYKTALTTFTPPSGKSGNAKKKTKTRQDIVHFSPL